MKKLTFYRILAVLLAAIFFSACTKESSDVRLESRLATSQLLNVTSNSATVVGFVTSQGAGFSEKGVCFNTAPAPTVSNSKVAYEGTSTSATFNVALTGLTYATKYYARAYATIVGSGTIYGEEYNFTTLPVIPTLTTAAITLITGNSAGSGGNVTVTGGNDPTVRGICYGTATQPTIAGSKTTDGKGPGAFVSAMTGLKGNTTYYVRAYATNSAGTAYGPEVTFKTLVDLPTVTTTAVSGISKVAAITGGEVTYDGGGTVTARGLAWGTSANPTITDKKIDGGTGLGAFISNLSGLTVSTTYHVRAYATNSAGTAYGADVVFTTLADITKLWLVGDYNGWDNSDNAKFIISTITSNGDAEGYAYLKSGGLKLVTDHSWSNPATFGDNGPGKLTNPGGNISVAADGYYLVKANIGTMTYSLTLTTWGIIGDATSGGWSDQTNMVYDATSLTFQLAAHLKTGGSFKFRGTSDWKINYGSTAANATLNLDGSNIPVTLEDDYAITLNLSVPNAYTYSANRWGVIGDATAGGWDTDANMTWDAVKKVFTVTLPLKATGSYKFRANDGWAVNLGGALNALVQDGGNLSVTSDGSYTLTLNPWTLKATATKN
jgi:hypothetical protein